MCFLRLFENNSFPCTVTTFFITFRLIYGMCLVRQPFFSTHAGVVCYCCCSAHAQDRTVIDGTRCTAVHCHFLYQYQSNGRWEGERKLLRLLVLRCRRAGRRRLPPGQRNGSRCQELTTRPNAVRPNCNARVQFERGCACLPCGAVSYASCSSGRKGRREGGGGEAGSLNTRRAALSVAR